MSAPLPSFCPMMNEATHPVLSPAAAAVRSSLQKRQDKIRILYEKYIHLEPVRSSWSAHVTEHPVLEPLFAAGMQGVELSFLLLAHFIDDSRGYVVKRPRIELVAEDIQAQWKLLAEIVDGELEDEEPPCATSPGCPDDGAPDGRRCCSLGTLTQPFPFEGAPPASLPRDSDKARQSPSLRFLIDSATAALESLRESEKRSLRKIVRNITGTFQSCFGEWMVGVGIEEQLSDLRVVVGLDPLSVPFGTVYLDYVSLVKPGTISETLTGVKYRHREDFFFRSVHLGTECWAFVALERLFSAMQEAQSARWHNAAARVRNAARILHYLGSHVMMLTSMVLRDYLRLKVEIEGTSGAGSETVKELKPASEALLNPLLNVLALRNSDAVAACNNTNIDACRQEGTADDMAMAELFIDLYSKPEQFPGLYDYAKSLEALESGLLGGFFYNHFCLAANVIGTGAKGTMKMAVLALKKTYEKPLFPVLDFVRAELGRRTDGELSHLKGRIMHEIENANNKADGGASCRGNGGQDKNKVLDRVMNRPLPEDVGFSQFRCPVSLDLSENLRKLLYSDLDVPETLTRAARDILPSPCFLSFLDHAWGKTPPSAQAAASKSQFALYQLGNTAWEHAFQHILPEAITHISRLLHLNPDSIVEFGHNSHELVTRLLSIKLESLLRDSSPTVQVRILTTDAEFYSFTRQMNRMLSLPRVEVQKVSLEPLETFESRFLDAARADKHDVIYVSQTVFLTQRTIVRDVKSFLNEIHGITAQGDVVRAWQSNPERMPFVILDGYHGFGALPTDLSSMPINCFYTSGMLKHVGGGANCAFLVVHSLTASLLRPLFTGWLADPSVLTADSPGIELGSEVGYERSYSLLGGTPAFLPSLLIFNEVMRRWSELGVTVGMVHNHVMILHRRFLDRLQVKRRGDDSDTMSQLSLLTPQPELIRAHTLVFQSSSLFDAKRVVDTLRDKFCIEVDSRKSCVRVGFGFNHSFEDVDRLVAALENVSDGNGWVGIL